MFHIFVGLPNLLYLCTVYKNFGLSWYRGPLKALESSVLEARAYLTWIDDNKHMNNGVYFSQFERGRRDWFFRVGSYKFFSQFDQGFVLTGLTTRFRKELEFLQPFKIITRLLYYDDYHIYLEQRIISQGFVHCIAYADCSIVNVKTKRRARTDAWIKFLGLSDDSNEKQKSNGISRKRETIGSGKAESVSRSNSRDLLMSQL